jgi:hypothetical protein
MRRAKLGWTNKGLNGPEIMKTADTLMVVYYVLLSGAVVFALGCLAGWRYTKGEAVTAQICTRVGVS